MGNNKKTYGLIGKLYHDVISDYSFRMLNDKSQRERSVSPRRYFLEHWLDIDDRYWNSLANCDTFESYYFDKVNSRISNDEEFEKEVGNDLKWLNKNKETVLNKLVEALENTACYKNERDGELKCYDSEAKNRLIKYIKSYNDIGIAHYIRWYIYFAVNRSVPLDFSESARTQEDLEEFSEKVLKRVGCSTKHAIREVIYLANRKPNPNTVALYEYADLLFFGNAEGIKQDMNEAFKKYKIAANIDNATEQFKGGSSHSNPLALWSLSYIYFNYKNPTIKGSLSDTHKIPELDILSFRDRIWRATKRASQAYSFSELPCAANTLGLIARLLDEDINSLDADSDPEIQELKQEIPTIKKEFNLRDSTYYFKEAAKNGFVYAYNNLAEEERRKFIKEIDNPESQKEHLDNYLGYLEKSANLDEAYAANKLGRIYLEGYKIIDSNIEEDKLNESIIDQEKAFRYFYKAYKAYHVFYDVYSAWACAHLCKYFSNRLREDEISDIKEIIDKYGDVEGLRELAYGDSLTSVKTR